MSVLIVRDVPGGMSQVLLDGKDITSELHGLSIRIEPDKKIAVLEFAEPEARVIQNAVIEAKISPDVLMEGEQIKRKRGKNATN